VIAALRKLNAPVRIGLRLAALHGFAQSAAGWHKDQIAVDCRRQPALSASTKRTSVLIRVNASVSAGAR